MVADMAADMEVHMVADMEVADKVADMEAERKKGVCKKQRRRKKGYLIW